MRTRTVLPIWTCRGFSRLASWRAQTESFCAVTLFDLLFVLHSRQRTWADLAGRDSAGLWRRWSRPPAGCVAV